MQNPRQNLAENLVKFIAILNLFYIFSNMFAIFITKIIKSFIRKLI